MISDLNLLCFHEYMCVLDPILQVYSQLLCVMIRQPEVMGWTDAVFSKTAMMLFYV